MVKKDIQEILKSIPESVTVVAATKYVGIDDMKTLFQNGIKDFGENRIETFLEKYETLNVPNIKWHFIGHIQTNKAKKVINKIDVLHSLDSVKLANIINGTRTVPLDCFIEVSINLEENKNGVPYYAVREFLKNIVHLDKIHLVGLMMMAKKESDDLSLEKQFKSLRLLRDELEKEFQIKLPYLSMGMSDDYKIAIKEGATHVRLGRILFDF